MSEGELVRLDSNAPSPPAVFRREAPGEIVAPSAASTPPPQPPSPYLTARQAAAYLNVSYGTFRNWATQIKRTKTGRYRKDDLDHFAQNRKKTPKRIAQKWGSR
jgi:hypothetical protein